MLNLSPYVPPLMLSAASYGAIPDAFFTDGAATSGSATFTSATANFTAADVGKLIVILRAGPSSLQDHHTTIASLDSSTQVQLTNTAGRTQSPARFYISRAGSQNASIQAAIDAAGLAGGATVFLPGVGYHVTGLVLKDRVTLQGMGMRSTMLHLGVAANAPVIQNDQTNNNSAMTCGIRDLWVDGARARQSYLTSTLNGAYTAGNATITLTDASSFFNAGALLIGTNRLRYTSKSGNVLSGVVGGMEGTTDASASNGASVAQGKATGVYLAPLPLTSTPTNADSYDTHFHLENVLIKDCRGDGFQEWGQSASRLNNVWTQVNDDLGFRFSFDTFVESCTADNNGRAGYYIFSSQTRLSNCSSFFSGALTAAEGNGYLLEGPTTIEEGCKSLVGCSAQDNKANGFYLRNAQRVAIQGSTASSNSTSSAGTYFGILVDGSTLGVVDLLCTERAATATQLNAIKIINTSNTTGQSRIFITHGGAAGAGALGTALASGSTLTGGLDLKINGMDGYTTASPAGAATYTPDPYIATYHDIQMPAGNITVAAPSNAHVGCGLQITIIQDSGGSRTVTWNSTYKWVGAAAPTLTTTASRRDVFQFRYNGTNWYEQSRDLNIG